MRRPDLTLLGSDACYKLDAPGLSESAKAAVAAVFDPGLSAEADVLVARYRAAHRHWSARKPPPPKDAKTWTPVLESTIAQDNAALNHLIVRLEALEPGDRRERDLIEAMMIHLDGPVGFRVQLALATIRPDWKNRADLSPFLTDELIGALSSCLSTKRGQQADGELLFLAAQLATLCERAGRRVTHSDQKAGEHLSAPQSAFGRLFETIVHDIDPSMPSSRLSRVLKALIKARGSAATGKRPAPPQPGSRRNRRRRLGSKSDGADQTRHAEHPSELNPGGPNRALWMSIEGWRAPSACAYHPPKKCSAKSTAATAIMAPPEKRLTARAAFGRALKTALEPKPTIR